MFGRDTIAVRFQIRRPTGPNQRWPRIGVVANGVAHKAQVSVLGEREGRLFLDPSLGPGASVVTEGRAALSEGDSVVVRKAGVGDESHSHEHQGPREAHGDTHAVRE